MAATLKNLYRTIVQFISQNPPNSVHTKAIFFYFSKSLLGTICHQCEIVEFQIILIDYRCPFVKVILTIMTTAYEKFSVEKISITIHLVEFHPQKCERNRNFVLLSLYFINLQNTRKRFNFSLGPSLPS